MTSQTSKISPFTNAVITAVRQLYPEVLADKSFDNTGLLLEAPHRDHLKKSVLLTVDLTTAVADEAIKRGDSIVIAYHPIIFRGLKSLTQSNTQTNTLLRLAQEGISVYCPHTAVDAAPGGLNDWLCDIFSSLGPSERTNITPHPSPPSTMSTAGYGRILRFSTPQPLNTLIKAITTSLNIPYLSVATPQSLSSNSARAHPISSIGICAGSGGSMLNGLDVDLLFTGELSHHEALAAIEMGKCVITAFHSNTERAFLGDRMKGLLEKEVTGVIAGLRQKGTWKVDEGFEVGVSEADRDPFYVVGRGVEGW
ncbi:NIF3 (NGG1p interacting factor 3)-like protein [Glarea lozoyensis ATCC 20868]|uniref:NIF3 (NGG1p interacting factor 3)-like protein n=1 Tax=Glarea lozoyensis (strain ATCC 20868 / MF5171) TaxID=1116229 RepID=S3DQX7_GLAL2|nr:NIF3 (NGG1p interacting factor 3)-like protein [Glarea lozoyensis ATCC 20868]EPE34426.1 NIF3 (NGG1p interacting factor 3)-like protein [Glarea lozoyensis ATCC 20868]